MRRSLARVPLGNLIAPDAVHQEQHGIFLLLGTFKTGSKVFPLPARMSADQAHITDGIMVW